eukprot:4374816-Pleurochrysis_carterae.AAC.1
MDIGAKFKTKSQDVTGCSSFGDEFRTSADDRLERVICCYRVKVVFRTTFRFDYLDTLVHTSTSVCRTCCVRFVLFDFLSVFVCPVSSTHSECGTKPRSTHRPAAPRLVAPPSGTPYC